MKRRAIAVAAVVLVAGLALLAAPTTVLASTEVHGPCPYEFEGAQSRTMGIAGCYDAATDTIFHNGDRRVLWHERGHAFDRHILTDADRSWFSARFFGGLPWWAPDPLDDGAGEKFAEFFAYCHMRAPRTSGGRRAQVATGYGLVVYTAKHRRFCNTVAILGLVRG